MKEMQAIETSQPTVAPAVHSRQLGAQLSGSMSFSSQMSKEDEEMSRKALSAFRAKEEDIEKKKMEIRERVQAQLGRVEEETKVLALIREELEGLADPMRTEVALVRKKIDFVNKELKPLGHTVQKRNESTKKLLKHSTKRTERRCSLSPSLWRYVGHMKVIKGHFLNEHTFLDGVDGGSTRGTLINVYVYLWDKASKEFYSKFNEIFFAPAVLLVTTVNTKHIGVLIKLIRVVAAVLSDLVVETHMLLEQFKSATLP